MESRDEVRIFQLLRATRMPKEEIELYTLKSGEYESWKGLAEWVLKVLRITGMQ
jgi:hypothetical protein